MAEVRSCVFVLLLLVTLENVSPKPFFGSLICDYICDDYDDSDSPEDDEYWCNCNSRGGRTSTTSTTMTPASQFSGNNSPVNLMIPPGDGLNATIAQTGGIWTFNLFPWAGQGGSAATAATTAAPGAAAATTAAPGATTAAPGATTAAPGATTAAAGATTAATTVAAGK